MSPDWVVIVKFDKTVQKLKRRMESDPMDSEARLGYHHALARIYGKEALPLLYNRTSWNEADPVLQDAAAGAVSRRIGTNFELLGVKNFTVSKQSHRLATYRHRLAAMEFSLLPGGGFRMGTPDLEAEVAFCERFDFLWEPEQIEDESPARWVNIPPFLMARTPLTQGQWSQMVNSEPNFIPRPWRGPSYPITGVSWNNARDWTKFAGHGLRLPTEAEWEYAARAGSTTRYYWGDEFADNKCWYGENSDARPHISEEDKDRTNSFGLIDMLGNVSEWCDDWDDPNQIFRSHRGGNWQESPPYCRSAHREGLTPDQRDEHSVGFRVAVSLPRSA